MKNLSKLKDRLKQQGELPLNLKGLNLPGRLPTGNLRIRPIDRPDQLKKFDLVIFSNGKKFFCHYLWHINKLITIGNDKTIITKNFKSFKDEHRVKFSSILGVVDNYKINSLGRLKIFFKSALDS